MILVEIPAPRDLRPLPFYLQLEEWVAKSLPPAEYFFTWRVNPTVIIGRHQAIDTEVDLSFCQSNGIEVVRRRSGGGCVYADSDNLMISYIAATEKSVPEVFRSFARRLADTLRSLGIPAEVSGRNDVLILGRKVCGCAYYRLPSRAIVHSTMLFNVDLPTMLRAITPDRAKLTDKGVKSVASRVTSISEHAPAVTIDTFREVLARQADTIVTLTPDQVAEIERQSLAYSNPAWLLGITTSPTLSFSRRFPEIGSVALHLILDGSTITGARFSGDFFAESEAMERLCSSMIGISLDDLSVLDTSQAIPGLTPKLFKELITT